MSKNRIIECLHCKKKLFELLKPIKDPCADSLDAFLQREFFNGKTVKIAKN